MQKNNGNILPIYANMNSEHRKHKFAISYYEYHTKLYTLIYHVGGMIFNEKLFEWRFFIRLKGIKERAICYFLDFPDFASRNL